MEKEKKTEASNGSEVSRQGFVKTAAGVAVGAVVGAAVGAVGASVLMPPKKLTPMLTGGGLNI